jgi:hypothetical protein
MSCTEESLDEEEEWSIEEKIDAKEESEEEDEITTMIDTEMMGDESDDVCTDAVMQPLTILSLNLYSSVL